MVLNCLPALKFVPNRPGLLPSFLEKAAQLMAPLLFIFTVSQFLLQVGSGSEFPACLGSPVALPQCLE